MDIQCSLTQCCANPASGPWRLLPSLEWSHEDSTQTGLHPSLAHINCGQVITLPQASGEWHCCFGNGNMQCGAPPGKGRPSSGTLSHGHHVPAPNPLPLLPHYSQPPFCTCGHTVVGVPCRPHHEARSPRGEGRDSLPASIPVPADLCIQPHFF